ncbi:DNA-protecting protein DprA [Kingella kingae]|uniref:DNA-processing protein DprA n=1 Tax=Kingella kingae TaxID=504 RepID=UPI00141337D0|nr:DNA-processing protein DprA [Kingella kingae]QIP52143.1 DNA-protecting protein DprA [Kingella kingae]
MVTESERCAWIELALTPYIGAESFLRLIEHCGSAAEALRAPVNLVAQLAHHGKQAAAAWTDKSKAKSACEAALQWEQQENCRLLLLCDDDYPQLLTEGLTPPPLLFVRGQMACLQRPAIGIVGGRRATPQAVRMAGDFGKALSEKGIAVISGMATGIDAAAHEGALQGSSSTIAVWGTGIDRIYPQSNQKLAYQIAERGAIISEFPLGTRPVAGNFPRRNRIIAALSWATLVVEATVESGSLITARLAAEMGREVMAIPSSIDNLLAKGCHKLIKEGAKLVECVDDIVQECPLLLGESVQAALDLPTTLSTRKKREKTAKPIAQISEVNEPETPSSLHENSDNVLLNAMGFLPIHPDLLAENLNLPAVDVYAELTELELDGWIVSMAGGRFQRVK